MIPAAGIAADPRAAAASAPENPLAGHARYKKVRDINHGAFGFVLLAEDQTTKELVALKFIERGPQHVTKYVEREIMNHMRLRHPHIIGLREVFLTEKHLVLSMEYAAGNDLFKYVSTRQRLSEDEARWFFQQLIVAVDYCHRMGVASRDIKLENTLLDGSPRPLIKLADFGFSKDANMQSAPQSRVGTPAYLAPEVITNQPGQVYSGGKADIWSCGVLLFVMVTGTYPFRRSGDAALKPNQKLNAMLQRILEADYSFPANRPLSEECKDLIRRVLVLDPDRRPSILEIQRHPWYSAGLHPAALQFNDAIVQESLANQPSDQTLSDIATIVNEARIIPSRATAAAAAAGGGVPGAPGAPPGAADFAGGAYGYAGPTDESLDDIIRELAQPTGEGDDFDMTM